MNVNGRMARSWAMLAVVAVGVTTAAGADVERVVPFAPGGDVSVELTSGSLRVEGWDRAEVSLTGEVEGGAERLEWTLREGAIEIEVDPMEGRRGVTSLTLKVPRVGELDVEAVACDLTLTGLEADRVRIEVAQGDVNARGSIGELDVEVVAGRIDVAGDVGGVRIESAAGSVDVSGVRVSAEIESISGPLRLRAAAPLRNVVLSTASGTVEYEGGLAPGAEMRVESLNGSVDLALDADIGAEVEIETFNGRVDVDWPGVAVGRDGDGRPGREVRFRLGDGSATIGVDTFNGRCTVRRRG